METDLSKWLKAATTVSFEKLYDTDTLANQLTTAPRISRNSAWWAKKKEQCTRKEVGSKNSRQTQH